ncbi:MAG: glycosyltransferase family 4 protein [Bacteroidota bacterium]|nr:glycosyltransferase family 4 protein [Bacteroidota bacterium]
MKILILPAYFTPESAASSYLGENLREALAKAAFEMVVYTPMPSRGISVEERNSYKKKVHETMYDNKLTVHRFNMFREGTNPLIRAFRYVCCCIRQFNLGRASKDIDVMFIGSTPPIQGAMAAMLKKVRKIPFIYNLQDVFPDSLVGTGLAKKNSLLWKVGRRIEDFTYKHADRIIVISEGFKSNILAKGVPEEKIDVVYNWVDENAVQHIERQSNKLFDRYNLDRNKFYISYCGNIGLTQNMDMLLEVASEFESIPDVQFVLIGEGVYKHKVETMISEKNCTNIRLLPLQPYEDISHVFSLGDVGLVISRPGVGENSVPSKTWSIMSAKRAVLASFDENELMTILTENKCGLFTKAGDKEAFKQAILWLYNNRSDCREFGLNGRRYVMKNLTRDVGTSKYIDVFNRFKVGQ